VVGFASANLARDRLELASSAGERCENGARDQSSILEPGPPEAGELGAELGEASGGLVQVTRVGSPEETIAAALGDRSESRRVFF
jgi:hypothetical protein